MENKNGVKLSKRVAAYLLDIMLLIFIISLINSIRFINPNYEEYVEYSNKYNEVMEKYYNNDINETELIELNKDNAYYLTKNGICYNIVTLVVIFGYFVLFQKYSGGQTLGKKIMKIKVTGMKDAPSLLNYFVRILPIYFIYIGGFIPVIINTILVYLLTPRNFLIANSVVNYLFLMISVVLFGSLVFRKDGRGFHDLLAKTKVVSEI